MITMQCPTCGYQVPDRAPCPNCGSTRRLVEGSAELRATANGTRLRDSARTWFLFALVAAVVVGGCGGGSGATYWNASEFSGQSVFTEEDVTGGGVSKAAAEELEACGFGTDEGTRVHLVGTFYANSVPGISGERTEAVTVPYAENFAEVSKGKLELKDTQEDVGGPEESPSQAAGEGKEVFEVKCVK